MIFVYVYILTHSSHVRTIHCISHICPYIYIYMHIHVTCWAFSLHRSCFGLSTASSIVFTHALVVSHRNSAMSGRKRKGGLLQRRSQVEEENAAAVGESKLAKFLLSKFAWGEISPQLVQEISALAVDDMQRLSDGKSMPDLDSLAALGGHGSSPQNCFRDLMRKLEPDLALARSYNAKLPFKEIGPTNQEFLLPHEMFASIYEQFPDAWQHSLLPEQTELPKWWEAVASHPQMVRHPVRDRSDYKQRCLPLLLHGDDVPVHGIGKGWTSKLTVFSWCSVLALDKSTRSKLFLTYASFEKARTKTTIDEWMKILAWSLWWLFLGLWPDSDPDGVEQLCL